ncbi:MAG: helix-turn-helix domain-containing protein, partial [Acidaminococcaceae bacterium]|nr:helix-turn-helix domain-containing protein [Acidaminococcaceae bacterium]
MDTVAQETNIRKIYLEAVEKNDYAALSGDVFVKGIMRTYGNYLGIDGAKLVEEYKAASTGNVPVKNNNTIRESQHVKVRPSFKSNRDIGSGTGSSHKVLYAIIGIILALLLAAGGIYFYLARSGQTGQLSLPFFTSDTDIANNDVKSDSYKINAAASENNNSIMNKTPVKDAADKKAAATQEKSVNKPVEAGNNSIASDTENDKRSGFTALTLT